MKKEISEPILKLLPKVEATNLHMTDGSVQAFILNAEAVLNSNQNLWPLIDNFIVHYAQTVRSLEDWIKELEDK